MSIIQHLQISKFTGLLFALISALLVCIAVVPTSAYAVEGTVGYVAAIKGDEAHLYASKANVPANTYTHVIPFMYYGDHEAEYYVPDEFLGIKTVVLKDPIADVRIRFRNATSINVDVLKTAKTPVTNLCFLGCEQLRSIDLTGIDTSRCTNMYGLFYQCVELREAKLQGLNTSNVTNMQRMFDECRFLTELDLSSWDTSKVEDMSYMFHKCYSLKTLQQNFNIANVTNAEHMFEVCSCLRSLDTSRFNTSKIENMNSMFANCSALKELDVSGFNTSHVSNMESMFAECRGLKMLDVSKFDTSNVWSMGWMFNGCESLETIDVSHFNTRVTSEYRAMFAGCISLKSLDLSSFIIKPGQQASLGGWYSNITMFRDCFSLASLTLGPNITNIELCELPEGIWVGPAGQKLTSEELMATYNPSSMAGTWICENPQLQKPVEPAYEIFTDVKKSDWFVDAVTFVNDKHIIMGYANDTFRPNNPVTRAQLATILWRIAEPAEYGVYIYRADNLTGMPDVKPDDWYTGAANWAVKNGVIGGMNTAQGKRFAPDVTINRETMCVMLMRYLNKGDESWPTTTLDKMPDANKVSSWARTAVAWALDKGLIKGVGGKYVDPHATVSRAVIAQLIYNAYEKGLFE